MLVFNMAFTQEQLTALETAIAQGAQSVRFNGREIRYQSTADMIRLRDTMRAELGVSAPTTARSKLITLSTGKGL